MLSTELFSIEQIIYIKMDLALNNLYWLICYQTKPNQNRFRFIPIVKRFPIHSFSIDSYSKTLYTTFLL